MNIVTSDQDERLALWEPSKVKSTSAKTCCKSNIFDLNSPKEDIITLAKAMIFVAFIIGALGGVLVAILMLR
jgi:hypothetical protein